MSNEPDWLEFFEDRERLYADYYLDFAQQHARRDPEAYERLERESGNLLRVADWLGEQEQADGILRLAQALWQESDFMRSRGFMQRGLPLLERAWEAARRIREVEAEIIWSEALANIHWHTGKPAQAQPLYENALNLARATNNLELQAKVQLGMGRLQTDMGRLEQAEVWLKLALDNYRLIQNYDGEINALAALAETLSLQGDYAKARTYLKQGLELALARQDSQGEMSLRFVLGYVEATAQNWDRAITNFEAATNIARVIGDRFFEVRGLHNMGEAWLALGNVQQAVAVLEEALERQEMIDDILTKAFTHSYLAKAYHALNELDKSLHQLKYVYPLRQIPVLAAEAAEAAWIEADIHLKQENIELAQSALADVLNLAPDHMTGPRHRAATLLKAIESEAEMPVGIDMDSS